MRCPRCNATVDDSALVCPECGLQFSDTESTIETEVETASQAAAPAEASSVIDSDTEDKTHAPSVEKIELVRKGKVRRAKLYYLRDRVGKAAKVKERI